MTAVAQAPAQVCAPEDSESTWLAQVCDQRAATYGLLSRLYRSEVDEELLGHMRTMRFPCATGNTAIDEGHRLIATYLSGAWENTLFELSVDYTRTFIGHGIDAYSAAYPFESVYTSERRLLMQDARDEVVAIYRSAGIEKDPSWREGEDHVALELEFMHIMAAQTAVALRAGNEDRAAALLLVQSNFLADHLAAWAPMMTTDMRRFAQTDLYRGLAFLTDGTLEEDREFLDEVLADVENDDIAPTGDAAAPHAEGGHHVVG